MYMYMFIYMYIDKISLRHLYQVYLRFRPCQLGADMSLQWSYYGSEDNVRTTFSTGEHLQ